MRFDLNRIYDLLPAIHRAKDSIEGLKMLEKSPEEWDESVYGPIKALLAIISKEAVSIEENIDQLYDDMFIETCQEWVVPYIGDLIGYRRLTKIPGENFNSRAEVANTIAYRRRKGTLSIVEQLASDVTGWKATVVEYFLRLATTQYMNHIRPNHLSASRITGDNWQQLDLVNTPFDSMPKSVDVRSIQSKRGKYNIPNIGIYLWRIKSYFVTERQPYKVNSRKFKFDVLGKDIKLYNWPSDEDEITSLASRKNVARPISRIEMSKLKKYFYGPNRSVTITYGGVPIDKAEIRICCLGDTNGAWINMPTEPNIVAIDPELGRIGFSQNKVVEKIKVTYCYGFASDIGGGEYERKINQDLPDSFTPILIDESVSDFLNQIPTLSSTMALGVYTIKDNSIYVKNSTENVIDKSIVIRSQNGNCAVIKCDDIWKLNCIPTGNEKIEIILDGLLIDADELVIEGDLSKLHIRHCTLNPQRTKIRVKSNTKVVVEDSIVGQLILPSTGALEIKNSIIDSGSIENMAIENAFNLSLENTTIIGGVSTAIAQLISNTIIYTDDQKAPVSSQRKQEGCVRYSFFPINSKLPSPFKCQPSTSGKTISPLFQSLAYGNAEFCLLSDACAQEIQVGADDESEMGVYHDLYQNQKIGNLKTRLEEYLRFGLEPGIFLGS